MNSARALLTLCRGETAGIAPLLEARDPRWWAACCVTIVLGCAAYGAVIGWWRAPIQGLFVALKMPLLLFLTCAGNALLNGLLAQVLGSGLSFRQSSLAILMSFTIAAMVLAALAPVAAFILFNAPPLASAHSWLGHSVVLLSDVLFIAYAGFVGNQRLLALLITICPSPAAAHRVFWSWLAGNLFLGAQLSWILRPFIGSPGLPVQFLRDEPMRGNFYEAVGHSFMQLLNSI